MTETSIGSWETRVADQSVAAICSVEAELGLGIGEVIARFEAAISIDYVIVDVSELRMREVRAVMRAALGPDANADETIAKLGPRLCIKHATDWLRTCLSAAGPVPAPTSLESPGDAVATTP